MSKPELFTGQRILKRFVQQGLCQAKIKLWSLYVQDDKYAVGVCEEDPTLRGLEQTESPLNRRMRAHHNL